MIRLVQLTLSDDVTYISTTHCNQVLSYFPANGKINIEARKEKKKLFLRDYFIAVQNIICVTTSTP